MKKVMNVLLATLFVTAAVSARMLHPVALEAVMDTSMNPAAPAAERSGQFGTMERHHPHSFTDAPREESGKYGPCGNYHRYNEPTCPGMMFHHAWRPWRRPLMTAWFFASWFFIWIAINILLTVLVWLDMMRRNQFNGLWIPVLLLMGIPGTGLYALFRIGDAIMAKERKS